jgi:amino acid adenylation domain-containing protein
MPAPPRTLRSGFLAACERFPERPALEVDGEAHSFARLHARAASLAATLEPGPAGEPPLTAVFGQRSLTTFAGILAALLRGHGYVPLNPQFPTERTRRMLERSGARSLVVDRAALPQLDTLLAGLAPGLRLLLPDVAPGDAEPLASRHPGHRFVSAAGLAAPGGFVPRPAEPGGIAYLLFTSGSTGMPKGVMVAHRNVTHFLDAMKARYAIDENDRFSQMFDLTFDLSVFDLFLAWEAGACVCCPSPRQKLVPASYVADARLSVWFSVPSSAVVLKKLRKLAPGVFPGLRLSLFCGEALPAELAAAWAEAAPRAIVENLYGPTELTIACTLYRWDPERSPRECERGLVPIGRPYPGMEALVVDEALREVAPGEAGELLMTGPQLSLGYWQDPERTAAAFVAPPGRSEVFYRTGDRVRRPAGDGPLVYLGRTDHQIKIQGYRVELGEIEATLREIARVDVAVAIGWPENASGADGVVAFLGAERLDVAEVLRHARARLPAYMAPREIRLVSEFPLNANGKVDRGALRAALAAGG